MFMPEPTLSKRIDPTPPACSASASWPPLPFVPGRSGDVQLRSVGPLPANNTTHAAALSPAGRQTVDGSTYPGLAISMSSVTALRFIEVAAREPDRDAAGATARGRARARR